MFSNSLSIGKPIANTQIYILDNNLQPLPVGVVGEMYIGGDGVARGYLNRPELTAQKFIDNPFGEGKLYKTGDSAYFLADGNIEFIGRIDNQVKVRGFRIELGEIESLLNQYPQVKETVVLAVENRYRSKELVAYLTTDKDALKISAIREFLAEKLPDYMIPSAFVFFKQFPLTPNGKIDKKALAKIEVVIDTEEEFAAPTNETESKLSSIWGELLGRDSIGINDNFFELGGHSLLAVKMIRFIAREFAVELSLKDLFIYVTVKQLSDFIIQKQLENLTPKQLNLFFDRIKENE